MVVVRSVRQVGSSPVSSRQGTPQTWVLARRANDTASQSSSADEVAAAFEEQGVSPEAVEWSDAFRRTDDPEPNFVVTSHARGVLGKVASLARRQRWPSRVPAAGEIDALVRGAA